MNALELVAVTKCYGTIVALDDYRITVPEGCVTAFVGANGSGKSTAMRILGGLREPDSGMALCGGRPLARAMRGRIGHMPENRGLYPDEPVTAQLRYFATLIGVPRQEVGPHVAITLERVGLAELAHRRFGTLSLGNQQRAQLALALLGSPQFLLLDEPFSGLDFDGVAQVSDLVRSLASDGAGILVSSHQLEVVAALSNRVAVIAGGRAVLEGNLTDVLGTTERQLCLEYRLNEGGDDALRQLGACEIELRALAERSGGRAVRRADLLVLELPITPGSDVDPGLLQSAASLGPLASISVSQPTLRTLVEANL